MVLPVWVLEGSGEHLAVLVHGHVGHVAFEDVVAGGAVTAELVAVLPCAEVGFAVVSFGVRGCGFDVSEFVKRLFRGDGA